MVANFMHFTYFAIRSTSRLTREPTLNCLSVVTSIVCRIRSIEKLNPFALPSWGLPRN